MTNFEGWCKLCNETNCDIHRISMATNRPNTGLYMTKGWYWDSNHRNIYYNDPVYQIWVDDERELAVMNGNGAIKHWAGLIKELGLEVENYGHLYVEGE